MSIALRLTEQDYFFQEAVRILCSSLRLEESSEMLFQFLQRYMPITCFSLGRGRRETQDVEERICFDLILTMGQEKKISAQSVPMSDGQFVQIRQSDFLQSAAFSGMCVMSEDAPLAHFLKSGSAGLIPARPPMFILRMQHAQTIVGTALFHCDADNWFTEEQLDLLRSLHDPLLIALSNYFQHQEIQGLKERLFQENARLRQQLQGLAKVEVVGTQGGLRDVMEKARMVGRADVPVLITGETGSGKELVARAVHEFSQRRSQAFVEVNCGAIPSSLIDTELFGHMKGAFTGASANHKGRFERAHGGTLFLDEIAELPLEVQARLLRVLQEHTIEPVGGDKPILVDFRLIAATNRDLRALVRSGEFREDLYYRLHVASLHLPPLRERRQDIPLLVKHFMQRLAPQFGVPVPPIAVGELQRLSAYHWPGNVRELRNVVEEALVFQGTEPLRFRLEEEHTVPSQEQGPPLAFDDAQVGYFRHLLKYCGGRINGPGGAAELSGIHPSTLRARLDKLNVPYGRDIPRG